MLVLTRPLFILLVALAAALSLAPSANADVGRIERADGTQIVYYFDPPDTEAAFPLIVLLQGSECRRVSDKYADQTALVQARGVAMLRLEKPGLRPDVPVGQCPPEYLRLNSPNRRVLDLLAVLEQLRRHEPRWNGHLGLAGGSEGCMVASLTAPLTPQARALLLYSGGGGWPFGEEVAASIARSMREQGAAEDAVRQQLEKIKDSWAEIRKDPVPHKEWASDGALGRNTFQWWNETLDMALYRPLLQIDLPIRAYHGKQDSSVVVDSAYALRDRFTQAGRTNLDLRLYTGGHAPPPEVLSEGLEWLVEQVTTATSAATPAP